MSLKEQHEQALTPKGRMDDDLAAKRLENAVWRMWRKDAKKASNSELQSLVEEEVDGSFLQKVQETIGEAVYFPEITFPQAERTGDYDDLPTFPIRPNFAGFKNQLAPASECVVFDGCPEDPYHPSNTPIYQTSTFVQPSASEFGAYDYTRSGNPTRTALEKHVAMLEQAAAAFAFASGMAALHTVTRLLRNGDDILANEDIYGGMHRLLTQDAVHNGIKVKFVDTTDLAALAAAITPATKMIHLESPSNPRMRITDLRAVCTMAHKHNVLVSVDSTMMPPVICKPLTLGVDIVVHSATKFFSGHADCTGGLVCVRDPEVAHRVAFLQNAEGTALAPFECFLFLRGIKTMFLRVEQAQANAQRVATFLLGNKHIDKVFFPGKGGCEARSLATHRSQCRGPGSVMSFTTGSVEFSRRMLDACRIFKTTVSFGSVNSLGEMPCTMSHASIPSEKRTLPADLVRLSVGIEDVNDLIADLNAAIEIAAEERSPERDGRFDSKFEDLPVVPNLDSFQRTTSAASAHPSQGAEPNARQAPANGKSAGSASKSPGPSPARKPLPAPAVPMSLEPLEQHPFTQDRCICFLAGVATAALVTLCIRHSRPSQS